MSVEILDTSYDAGLTLSNDDLEVDMKAPLNGTDARRRLEDKIDDFRLRKEILDYDFDI